MSSVAPEEASPLEAPSDPPLSSSKAQLAAAQKAQDFERACRVLKAFFTATGAQLIRQCTRSQVFYDPDFWPQKAQRAERARAIHAAYMKKAKERAALRMREEGLDDFADALESGDYAALSF